ncbi:MAG: hypothetical protein V3V18_07900 [Methylococcales bacterium]
MLYKSKIIQYAIVTICIIGLLFSFTPIVARLTSNDHHAETDGYTGIGTEFPPQFNNMENIKYLNRDSNNQAIGSRGSAALISTLSSDDVHELGDRFTFVGTTKTGGKTSQSSKTSNTYFSHSTNTTVEVLLNQGEIESVKQVSPSEYQPPLTEEEVNEAVKIARETLIEDGFERIQQLEGYGILAFKPSSEISPGDEGFYETRVVYVSFHEHIDARPEFIAWVDLTEQVVIKSQEDQL